MLLTIYILKNRINNLLVGDLVKLTGTVSTLGVIMYKHPTKSVVRVYWPDDTPSWESCARLEIIASYDQNEVCLPR